jgi:hypothetical protein
MEKEREEGRKEGRKEGSKVVEDKEEVVVKVLVGGGEGRRVNKD